MNPKQHKKDINFKEWSSEEEKHENFIILRFSSFSLLASRR